MHRTRDGWNQAPPPAGSFLLTFIVALGLALGAAVTVAPIAAMAVVEAGFHFPFPRIFDRTVMVALGAILLLFAHRLGLPDFLRRGFRTTQASLRHALGGLALAAAAIGLL